MLDNLLGITNEIELAKEEERLTKTRAMELWDKGIIERMEPGAIDTLFQIHHYLFQDVYSFAGHLRTVNLAKGNFRFAPLLFLESQLAIIDTMSDNTWEEIVNKYVEVNVAHPFREGNGRAGRIWLDLLVEKRLTKRIAWENISRDAYMEAMVRSPVNSTELRVLLEDNLTTVTSTRSMFAHIVNINYEYEGYSSYDANDL